MSHGHDVTVTTRSMQLWSYPGRRWSERSPSGGAVPIPSVALEGAGVILGFLGDQPGWLWGWCQDHGHSLQSAGGQLLGCLWNAGHAEQQLSGSVPRAVLIRRREAPRNRAKKPRGRSTGS